MENTTSNESGARQTRPKAPRSDIVRRVRDKLGLTQEDMAREMDCSVNTVSKMEQENREPGTRAGRSALQRLADRAGIDYGKVVSAQTEG